jgi:hypothetical protein
MPDPDDGFAIFLTYVPAIAGLAVLLGYVVLPYFFPWWGYNTP